MTYLVLGANNFGHNHAKILAKHPSTTELVVTATSEDSVDSAVAKLKSFERKGLRIVGLEAKTPEQFRGIASAYKPVLTCVNIPTNHHIEAINAVAESSEFVLCEKPIGSVVDTPVMEKLEIDPDKLSIELPIYTMMKEFLGGDTADEVIRASNLYVHWTLHHNNALAVDDILPHAWSALAPLGKVIVSNVGFLDDLMQVEGKVMGERRDIPYQIRFGYADKPMRQISTPNRRFVFDGPKINTQGYEAHNAGNPLGKNIYAALRGKPIADYNVAKECQEFIELVHELL